MLPGLRNKRLILTKPAEAAVLNQITARRVRPEERDRWDQLVSEHHYLKNANLVGERLCYVAEYQGQWLALLGCSPRADALGTGSSARPLGAFRRSALEVPLLHKAPPVAQWLPQTNSALSQDALLQPQTNPIQQVIWCLPQ